MLTSKQFEQAKSLALRLAGIELVERHREILSRRYSRLEIGGGGRLDSLLSRAEAGDPAASQQLLRLFTTNVTAFFRHPAHFAIAAEHALRVASQRQQVRCWSAAASTGEEPYSLAIALAGVFREGARAFSILATDVDQETLEAARRAEYTERDVADLEPRVLDRFFDKTSAHHWEIKSELRRLVEFEPQNLIDVAWHNIEGPFDIIFCRNVLMYLEPSHRYSVAERMASILATDGLFFLDPAEYLGKAGHFFARVASGVYSLRRASNQGQTR